MIDNMIIIVQYRILDVKRCPRIFLDDGITTRVIPGMKYQECNKYVISVCVAGGSLLLSLVSTIFNMVREPGVLRNTDLVRLTSIMQVYWCALIVLFCHTSTILSLSTAVPDMLRVAVVLDKQSPGLLDTECHGGWWRQPKLDESSPVIELRHVTNDFS